VLRLKPSVLRPVQAARSSASLRIGCQNRFMIVTYAVWIVLAAAQASPTSASTQVLSQRTSYD
jgi:hypothetical protein